MLRSIVLVLLLFPALAWADEKATAGDTAQTSALSPVASADCHRGHLYPSIAIRLNHEGVTTLGFTVNADGSVSDVHVVESSGHNELDEAAVTETTCWHYKPAVKDGKPVAVLWKATVTWRIRGS